MTDILFYKNQHGAVNVEVRFEKETFWLTQKAMAELFDVKVPAINKHLSNIFESEELKEGTVVSKMEITASDGKNYITKLYNLDVVIAVGYRVNSHKATQFRIWATQTLKEFIIKGFVLDNERLKQEYLMIEEEHQTIRVVRLKNEILKQKYPVITT